MGVQLQESFPGLEGLGCKVEAGLAVEGYKNLVVSINRGTAIKTPIYYDQTPNPKP